MKILLTFLTLLCSVAIADAQKFDTLYYDKDWKVAKNALFASYYRIYDASDKSPNGKPFRDYYISGQLQSEGKYISIDPYDDSKSVFDGEMINYYKNGQIQYKRFENRGVKQGEAFAYYENGKREPGLATLVLMSEYFNKSINYLITGVEFKKK